MCGLARDDVRPGGCARDAVAELEVELPAQNIEERILRAVDVQGWSTRQTRVAPHPERPSRLLAGGEYLGDVRLAPNRPENRRALLGSTTNPCGSWAPSMALMDRTMSIIATSASCTVNLVVAIDPRRRGFRRRDGMGILLPHLILNDWRDTITHRMSV
jgi:hypothetical protein